MLLQIQASWLVIGASLFILVVLIAFSWRELIKRVAVDDSRKSITLQLFVTIWLCVYALLGWLLLFKDDGVWSITAVYIAIILVCFWGTRLILALVYWLDIVLE